MVVRWRLTRLLLSDAADADAGADAGAGAGADSADTLVAVTYRWIDSYTMRHATAEHATAAIANCPFKKEKSEILGKPWQ